MFNVEISRIDELYALVNEGKRISISSTGTLLQGACRKIFTTIDALRDTYSIALELDVKLNTDLPISELETKLSDFEVKSSSGTQVILSKDECEYVIQSDTLTNNISARGPKTRQGFEHLLHNYAKILSYLVESHYQKAGIGCPNVTYFLGRDFSDSTPPERRKKVTAGPSETVFDLDSFEQKIMIADPDVAWEDIGGCKQGKAKMVRILFDIQHPELALFMGRDPEKKKSYLLHGEAGSGKTLLVKALATRLKRELDGKIRFYAVNYEDITSIFRGGEAQATGMIFDLVERNETEGLKTLVFLDELHLIGIRSKGLGPKDEALDTLLAHLDGMKKYKGLTVIGATYMPLDSLDSALIRPGRLSSKIEILPPDLVEREEIIQIYVNRARKLAGDAGNGSLFGELDLKKVSKATEGYNGSHLAGLTEALLEWKESQVRESTGVHTLEGYSNVLVPITTEDFLHFANNYQKPERHHNLIGYSK